MKKIFPFLMLALGLALVARKLTPPSNPTAFDVVGFGGLPVLHNGRIKPLDTIARSSLLQFQGRQNIERPGEGKLVSSPSEWLLDVAFRAEKADTYPTFLVDDPDIYALLGKKESDLKVTYKGLGDQLKALGGMNPTYNRRFSFNDIWPHREAIQEKAQQSDKVESALRTPFQRAILQLYANILNYQRLKHSFIMPGSADFLGELLRFQDQVVAGVAAVRAKQAGQPHDEAAVNAMITMGEQFSMMENVSTYHLIPPDTGESDPTAWKTTGAVLLGTFQSGNVNATALAYAGLAHAWRAQQSEQFNKLIQLYRDGLAKRFAPVLEKTKAESRFKAAEPFYTSMLLYFLAGLCGVIAWLKWPDAMGTAAFWLTGLAWLVATGGILMRMWLEGRPPVTNLYSSALFVGWGAVALCLVLEYVYKNAVGSVAAGIIGFATLQIAHHLSLAGDTLEMMRAVLDSNFWLATHVIVVVAGYSATFLAGFLAIIYIFRGLFTRTLDKATADSLTRMVYGIVCFATLFSFVGTILGGIWADQSWGRFWGWDPKENGAMIIVIWNAIILHARWGGMIKQRGLMALAIGGNIVTSWSWFGTNMLGVGLHSYGFTDSAFAALSTFVLSQLAIIALANVPLHKWRSFRDGGGGSGGTGGAARLEPVAVK